MRINHPRRSILVKKDSLNIFPLSEQHLELLFNSGSSLLHLKNFRITHYEFRLKEFKGSVYCTRLPTILASNHWYCSIRRTTQRLLEMDITATLNSHTEAPPKIEIPISKSQTNLTNKKINTLLRRLFQKVPFIHDGGIGGIRTVARYSPSQ